MQIAAIDSRDAVSPINPRLLIPAITLVSFATTLGLISWSSAAWRGAPAPMLVVPAAPAPTMPPAPAPATVVADPQSPQQDAAPLPEDPSAQASAVQPADTAEFLAAQDRAAAHSSRSR